MSDIPFTLSDIDFLQEELNFTSVSPVEFEKLVFHLLDEMGFSNLTWRKGGEGNSATDGGRDLEATFWTVLPAISKEEKYWFEVKHRKNQLEKSQVQNTILNASGNNSKDNLVIITNSTISNPTLDWITEFQSSHKTPRISIWQGHDLELILRKNPRTLAMFLPSSLAFSGRCKVIESKFSNLLHLPAGPELNELWEHRGNFYENSYLTLAAIIGEVEYGDIIKHSWGTDLDEIRLISVVATGMLNVYPFIYKCNSLNREQRVLIEGLAYITECLLLKSGAEITSNILFDPERLNEDATSLPDELKIMRYEPIIKTICDDIGIHCSSNYCMKFHYSSRTKDNNYFLRFIEPSKMPKENDVYLVRKSITDKCEIGLIPIDKYCPFGEHDDFPKDREGLNELLEIVRKVLTIRSQELISNN